MKTKSLSSELVVVLLLALVPLPGPQDPRPPCHRDRSSVVRNIVSKKWVPILARYGLKLPIECPFHPSREVYWPRQESKIKHRATQWSCGLCGKSFYSEKFLEMHFENRHSEHLNTAEDSVCLADYCDIMRCTVWEHGIKGSPTSNTDVELWGRDQANSAALVVSKTALQPVQQQKAKRGEVVVTPTSAPKAGTNPDLKVNRSQHRPVTNQNCNNSRSKRSSDAAGADCSRINTQDEQIKRFKADCRPDLLNELRDQCENLVWDCIAGLLANLTTEEFKSIEADMNRAICWYLTCDRYWENSANDRRKFPWALLLVLVTALALVICFCYYLIWLVCDWEYRGNKGSLSEPSSPLMQHQQGPLGHQHHHMHHQQAIPMPYHGDEFSMDGEPYYVAENQGEHYIYVTYPPELKRRLMESCYNRTSRI
ncbi:uncharacterized protein LOC132195241 isoform X2 [Neocloeon triangulifer]|uniref:uncharacterized protein LOC132195241 isoform X2 n=1 Tax=Neocloeon triangulifer TaxID=2078957 RepID=UPI00286FAB82|nr:uncharacterized protein LOC132195241 isoform X2 [Neocloeon triangulifer]